MSGWNEEEDTGCSSSPCSLSLRENPLRPWKENRDDKGLVKDNRRDLGCLSQRILTFSTTNVDNNGEEDRPFHWLVDTA